MKFKRMVATVFALAVLACCMTMGISYAWTRTDAGDKNFDIGYASVRGYGKAYCKTGLIYDTCKAEFFFYEESIGVTEEADVLNSMLSVAVYKYQNGACLDSRLYDNDTPKPNNHYESTKYRYSDNWCYKANGTKTVITCEHAEGDGGPATYQKYTYQVH